MQKDYIETRSCLMIECRMLGWDRQVPDMFLLSSVFSECLKMDFGCAFWVWPVEAAGSAVLHRFYIMCGPLL